MNFNYITPTPQSAPAEPSSLDRFVWNKSWSLIGYVGPRGQALWHLIAGLSMGLTGLGLTIGSLAAFTSAAFIPLFATGFPLFVAGIVTTALGVRLKKRFAPVAPSDVRLTYDGQMFLIKLANHVGWTNGHQRWAHNNWRYWSNIAFGGPRTASQLLDAETFNALNAAAAEYNRICGLLENHQMKTQRTFKEKQPVFKAAADEAMTVALNNAAILEKFPESRGEGLRTVQGKTNDLKELADHIERMFGLPQTLTETLSDSSVMNQVLEQLRLDKIARTELSELDKDELRDHLSN